jgi:hypothetical protein
MSEFERLQSLLTDLENRFTYHSPSAQQAEVYQAIRSTGREYAQMLAHLLPESRETSLAVTHLEEVVFWANAAIARHGLRSEAAS